MSQPKTFQDALYSESEKSWLACFIDAEGVISLDKDSRHESFNVKVSVYNTNFEFIQRFASLTGAKIHSRPPHGFGRKEQFEVWITSKAKVKSLLEVILPYLIVKRAKAEAVLAYIEKKPFNRTRNMAYQNTV